MFTFHCHPRHIYVSKVCFTFQGTALFPKIAKVAMVILAIPAASAVCETIWSDAARIDTDERSNVAV